MPSFKATWTDWNHSEERLVKGVSGVREIIDSLSGSDPPVILLLWKEGTTRELGVGIGREQTVITYQESADPPYFISLGQPDAQGVEWFCHGQEQTDYLARNLVSAALILPTVKNFMGKRSRPDTVNWEQP